MIWGPTRLFNIEPYLSANVSAGGMSTVLNYLYLYMQFNKDNYYCN